MVQNAHYHDLLEDQDQNGANLHLEKCMRPTTCSYPSVAAVLILAGEHLTAHFTGQVCNITLNLAQMAGLMGV